MHEVVALIGGLVTELNEYFTKEEPWKKSGDEKELIIKTALEKLQIITSLYMPIMPRTAQVVLDAISNGASVEAIFKRIV